MLTRRKLLVRALTALAAAPLVLAGRTAAAKGAKPATPAKPAPAKPRTIWIGHR